MAPIPKRKDLIAEAIDKKIANEAKGRKPRGHMGCSQLGHPCDRWLWLSFRWACREEFSGRMLRLFDRGQREEEVITKHLVNIGCSIQTRDENGQIRVSFGSHVSGSVDGIISFGVRGAEKTPHVAEFKTHNKKSFEKVVKEGVKKAKPQHYIQMQVYMKGLKLKRALYVAVCKDNDEYYTERVEYDAEIAKSAIERGQRIALSEELPPKLSEDPSWYQCKFCAAHSMCHKKEPTKQVNCRTCAFVTPTKNSTWLCAKHDNSPIPEDFQWKGCESHVLHPGTVPWKMRPSEHEHIALYEIDGEEVANGEPDANVFGSKEIIANPSACAQKDAQRIRKSLEAKVVD